LDGKIRTPKITARSQIKSWVALVSREAYPRLLRKPSLKGSVNRETTSRQVNLGKIIYLQEKESPMLLSG
jgi:hypothetical protein